MDRDSDTDRDTGEDTDMVNEALAISTKKNPQTTVHIFFNLKEKK